MIRKTIILVLTLAAVGTAAAGGLSVLGYSVVFGVGHDNPTRHASLGAQDGRVRVGYGLVVEFDEIRRSTWSRWGIMLMFACGLDPQDNNQLVDLSMPFWMPLILFATYPTVAFIRGPFRRYRRRRRGLCPTCGYDLTGNTSGVCSECATKVET